MPASDTLCKRMYEMFGWPKAEPGVALPRPDPIGPMKYLLAKGYSYDEKKHVLSPPSPDHVPTQKQINCIEFLAAEQPK
jgi:hypothetical protein